MMCINNWRLAATLAATMTVLLTGCSSSPVSKGVLGGQLGICPSSPNCVSSYNADETHKISAMRFNGDRDAAKRKLLTILNLRKGVEIKEDNGSYVWATFKSPFMGFVDDAEFFIKDNRIEVRSASRVGYSDFGANRDRMNEIRAQFEPCCD